MTITVRATCTRARSSCSERKSVMCLCRPSVPFLVFACQESSYIPTRSKNYSFCSLWKDHPDSLPLLDLYHLHLLTFSCASFPLLRLYNYSSLIVSYFFAFLLFWAPLCLVGGAKQYFFGALYKNSDGYSSFMIPVSGGIFAHLSPFLLVVLFVLY